MTVTITQDELPVYIAGEWIPPYPLLRVPTATDDSNKAMEVSRIKNLLWIIARHVYAVTQQIAKFDKIQHHSQGIY